MDKTIEYSWTVPPGEPLSACWKERDIFDEVLRKYLPEPTHRSGSDQGTEITKVYSLDALTVFVIKNFFAVQQVSRTSDQEWDGEKTISQPGHHGTTRVHLFYGDEKKDLAQRLINDLEQKRASTTDPASPVHSLGR